ncbi:hypothetical protein D477_016095 [Arthrobacter crystallopoietes BAB-32]|uniref:HEPN AbiU2-like domain-containing protein n=1 Tax=Arthrobacter crystallopoietes BAB-32 TaxID=1246476 RepID=N1UZE4_9MICC|nr:hypothetical protein D477_016095 [Arthrobacter crystallopoietes BAB-32]
MLLERITLEVSGLLENRRIWQDLQARNGPTYGVARGRPADGHPPEATDRDHDWLVQLYYRDAALGIRRMVDGDRRTGSLKRLLQKMAEDPRLLPETWFLAGSSGSRREELAAAFKERADTLWFGHLNPAVPRADLAELSSATAGIKCWVDQHITHAQLDPHSTQPPPSDIDAALDLLARLLEKYTFLLRPHGGAGGISASRG